jgi:hypothetical protein
MEQKELNYHVLMLLNALTEANKEVITDDTFGYAKAYGILTGTIYGFITSVTDLKTKDIEDYAGIEPSII